MKTTEEKNRMPFGLIAIYAIGIVLIALNLTNYLLN